MYNEVINTYNYNGTQVGSIGLNGYVSDIEYDSAGNLFSYTSTGLWMYDGISNTKISTFTAPNNYGGDIAIFSADVIAVSQTDTSSGIYTFDYSGTFLGSFGLSGAVSDIEYGSAGNLYSFTSTGIWKYDGSINTLVTSSIAAPSMGGGDITLTPEPLSSILFITGGATLGFRRFWKKRRSD